MQKEEIIKIGEASKDGMDAAKAVAGHGGLIKVSKRVTMVQMTSEVSLGMHIVGNSYKRGHGPVRTLLSFQDFMIRTLQKAKGFGDSRQGEFRGRTELLGQ